MLPVVVTHEAASEVVVTMALVGVLVGLEEMWVR